MKLGPIVAGDLIVTKLRDTRYRVVAASSYLAAVPLHQLEDLSHHQASLFSIQPFRSRWIFEDIALHRTEQPMDGDLVLSPAGAIMGAALAGLGSALLPDWLVAADLCAGRLQDCFPGHWLTAISSQTADWLMYTSRSSLPCKVRAMIDFHEHNLQTDLWSGDAAAMPLTKSSWAIRADAAVRPDC